MKKIPSALLWLPTVCVVAALALSSILTPQGLDAAHFHTEQSEKVEHYLSVYKRTYSSLEPFHDGQFLQSVLGMSVITSQTVLNGENETCANREVLTTLDNFQLHFFHSFKYPESGRAETWLEKWSKENLNISALTWNEFAMPSVSLYSPWLTPFLQRLEARKVYHLRFFQVHESGTIIYSIILGIPYAGLTIQVISDENMGSSDRNSFHPFDERMCPNSLQVHQDIVQLGSLHSLLGGVRENVHGLPDLLLVSLGFPSTTPSAFYDFFSTIFGGIGIYPMSMTFSNGNCDVWAVELANTVTVNGTAITSPVYLKAVANTLACPGTGNFTLRRFEQDVEKAHHKYMSVPNEGWDAYVDMHPGIHVNEKLLDSIPETLTGHDYGYTMHPQFPGSNAGSIWTAGITPWAMEIQGAFSKDDRFRDLSVIDYCSASTDGDTRTNINIIIQND
ncbi:hypothetical protein CTAYLR_004362 [Chrysophaeum taylorii]|uniref:Uncharacterized protein n=1 Tax=Chrysophaeum taylorii TaxID=2483200 RepID=A0AAD7XQW1_9STRA|nr:hypothetical protein CTAYLR_004362 [Chrysophaeum taylorii]